MKADFKALSYVEAYEEYISHYDPLNEFEGGLYL